jgi:hypothetical protein
MARHIYVRYGSGQIFASKEIARAKRNGELVSARAFHCSDCASPASEYDHRDYNFPLAVEPVCRGCNRRRGFAIPKAWSFQEFREWFVSYGLFVGRWGRPELLDRVERHYFS